MDNDKKQIFEVWKIFKIRFQFSNYVIEELIFLISLNLKFYFICSVYKLNLRHFKISTQKYVINFIIIIYVVCTITSTTECFFSHFQSLYIIKNR